MDITKLSAAKLESLYAKRSEASSAITTRLIEAGRGHELHSETMAKGKAGANPLSVEAYKASLAFCEVIHEQRDRREYSGTLRPIKRA